MKDGQLLVSDRASVSGTGAVQALLAGFVASVAMVMELWLSLRSSSST